MLFFSTHAVAGAGASVVHLMRVPVDAVPLAAIIFGVIGVLCFPLVRALARRLEGSSGPTRLAPDVADRLDRIERAVESVALEVERISEGQRFVTKLMAERAAPPAALPPESGSTHR
jgi:hypothetical protein